MSEPVVFLALPHYGQFTAPTVMGVLTASFKAQPLVQFESASLLSCCFNRLWAECLNLRVRVGVQRRPTHFAMLHADVGPDPGWLDVLLEEMDRVGADVLSCVVPIKDQRGLTSTGVQDPHTGAIRRFTMAEVFRFPETFDAAGCGYPDKPLMVNTGCWIARLDRPWVEDFTGFTILDSVHKIGGLHAVGVISEDWNASRWWADRGVRVFATRKVPVAHVGAGVYRNDQVWGDWTIDKGDLAMAEGEVEGWMNPEELEWLREKSALCHGGAVEVGCWHGKTTLALAECCPGPVVAVDHFKGSPGDRVAALAEAEVSGEGERARQQFRKNLGVELQAGRVRLVEADSAEAAARLKSEGFTADLILLDGTHEEGAVRRDIEAWRGLVRPGGVLCGHDRTLPGVQRAIDALLPGWKPAAGTLWEYEVA